jgi:hypothetical protein
VDDDRTPRYPVEPVELRPELVPVLARALSTVVDALGFGEQTPPGLIGELEHAAAVAMSKAYEPMAETSSRLAWFTESSRLEEAASARRRAAETLNLVSQTAIALQRRHDRLAEHVAEEATVAARSAAASSVPGHKLAARKQAFQKGTAVRVAAAMLVDQRAAAAALTAAAARQAALQLATETERAAATVERDALQAAANIQAIALTIMYEIAIDAACRHFLSPTPRTDDPHA